MKKLPQLNKRTNKISISLSGFNRCACSCMSCTCPIGQQEQLVAVFNVNTLFGTATVQVMQG